MGMFDVMLHFSILLVAFLLSFFPAQAEESRILWSKKTDWGEVRVRQEANIRYLMFADEDGETEESRMLLDKPLELQARYLRQMREAAKRLYGHLERPRFLVIGMGAGSLSRALATDYPEAVVTSVEIEPVVVEAARKYFLYEDSESLVTVIDDARHFLETSNARYDAIFLDAFDGVEVPEALRTLEFAQLLDQHLEKPQGSVIANVHFVPRESSLRYQRTLAELFPERCLLNGTAQGVGIYTYQNRPWALWGPHSLNWQLMEPVSEQDLSGIQPYRDGQP